MEQAPVTYAIIGITVLISLTTGQDPIRKQGMMLYPYGMSRSRSLTQFITHGFIHGDSNHLLFNMLTLFFFGPAVEYVFGPVIYVSLYLSAIVIAAVPSYLRHRNDPSYRSLGASGAISALVFVVVILAPVSTLRLFFMIPFPAFFLGAAFLVLSYYLSRNKVDNIEHLAHLSGAVYGLIFTLVYLPGSMGNFVDQIMQFDLLEWLNRELSY
jgi:membrane associated rhomboid family serine protease